MTKTNLLLKEIFVKGIKQGLKTTLWISKMMIPITFVVALLKWAGAIEFIGTALAPVLKHIGLSAEGVLVFITTALSSIYSGIAVMATLNIEYRAVTILAVMGLICHNLIIETVIQKKAGSNPYLVVAIRIIGALFAAWSMNLILPVGYTGTLILPEIPPADNTLWGVVVEWFWQMATLLPYMLVLILSLNILQQILRTFDLVRILTIPLRPFMKVFGLSKDSSFLWIILNTLGLAYGGAVLISSVKEKEITAREASLLGTHASITHSVLEDTLLLLAIGVTMFWLVIPRFIISIVAVWSQRLYYYIKDRKINKTECHPKA